MKKEKVIKQDKQSKPTDSYYNMEVTRTYLKRQKPILTVRNKFNGGVLTDNNLILPDTYTNNNTPCSLSNYTQEINENSKDVNTYYDREDMYECYANNNQAYVNNNLMDVEEDDMNFNNTIYTDYQLQNDYFYSNRGRYDHMVSPGISQQELTLYNQDQDDLFKDTCQVTEDARNKKRMLIDEAYESSYIYSCEPCMKRFKRLSTLKIHIFSHIQDAEIFKCPKISCDSGFKSLSIAIKHIMHFHREGRKNMVEHLKKSKYINVFRSYTALIDYFKTERSNPFKGSFCFGCFTYPRSMNEHPCSGIFYALTQCPACRMEVKVDCLEIHVHEDECKRTPVKKKDLM